MTSLNTNAMHTAKYIKASEVNSPLQAGFEGNGWYISVNGNSVKVDGPGNYTAEGTKIEPEEE